MKKIFRMAGAACVAASALAATSVQAQSVQQQDCQLSVFFPINVSTPNQAQANAIAQFVRGARTDIIAINGFASDIGSPARNQVLSQARATNVAAVVTSTGARVAAQGFGESGPGAANQRTDVVRDDCADAVVDLGPGIYVAPALGLAGLLLLLGEDSGSGSSTSTTGSTAVAE